MIEAVDVHPIRRKLAPGTLAVGEHLPEPLRARGSAGEAAAHAHDGDGARVVGLHGMYLFGVSPSEGQACLFSTRLVSAAVICTYLAALLGMYLGTHDRSAIQGSFQDAS